MAAPRAFQALQRASWLPGSSWCQLQQVRFRKDSKRKIRLPSEAKSKEKWVPWSAPSAKRKAASAVTKQPWEVIVADEPTDDVWIKCRYPPRIHTLQEAIQQHKELVANPVMMNMPDTLLQLNATLNMRTKKKTKMVANFTNSILLPHKFDAGQNLRVIVFTTNEEDAERMVEKGAVAAGSTELIKQISIGELTLDDYDYALCHVDMLSPITNLRKYMKDAFPTKARGQIGEDVDEMLKLFIEGVVYNSEKTTDNLAVAKIDVKLGPLSFDTNQLVENFQAYINAFNAQRPGTAAEQGEFVTSGVITCPPSPEVFVLHEDSLVPTELPQKGNKGKKKDVMSEDLKAMASMAASVQA